MSNEKVIVIFPGDYAGKQGGVFEVSGKLRKAFSNEGIFITGGARNDAFTLFENDDAPVTAAGLSALFQGLSFRPLEDAEMSWEHITHELGFESLYQEIKEDRPMVFIAEPK